MGNRDSYSADETVKYYETLAHSGLFNYEKEIITRFFRTPGVVLDIGCGAGRTTAAIRKIGYDVIGVDYSQNMIDTARRLSPDIQYEVQDVRDLSFDDASFEYAFFSFNGLMLLKTYEDRKKATIEIGRVLKNDGLFFFTTPFYDNKIEKGYWIEKFNKYGKQLADLTKSEKISIGDIIICDYGIEFYIHIPFLKEIMDMMSECGYEIIYSSRRLDDFPEEKMEDELDDNYIWVVRKNHVQI